jgi:hypothetical protein
MAREGTGRERVAAEVAAREGMGAEKGRDGSGDVST